MMYELIKANRDLLLSRSAELSAQSGGYSDQQVAELGRVSVFFDQLTDVLHLEHGTPDEEDKPLAGSIGLAPAAKMSTAAYAHGVALRDSNLTIDALVRNYGNVCQAITGYAVEVDAAFDAAEFKTLNWCLDEAISQAAVAFTTSALPDAERLNVVRSKPEERLDDMAKMTNHIEFIATTVTAMRTGQVGLDGATGALLDASLNAMRDLVGQGIDRQF